MGIDKFIYKKKGDDKVVLVFVFLCFISMAAYNQHTATVNYIFNRAISLIVLLFAFYILFEYIKTIFTKYSFFCTSDSLCIEINSLQTTRMNFEKNVTFSLSICDHNFIRILSFPIVDIKTSPYYELNVYDISNQKIKVIDICLPSEECDSFIENFQKKITTKITILK